jgi:hypothetical protein
MFGYRLHETSELRLLEERHAPELTELTDRKNFIRATLRQLANNDGF